MAAPSVSVDNSDQLRLARQVLAESIYQRIHVALSRAGIEHLVLKGPHLASSFYPRPWHREYNDIDVLVRPLDFQTAIKALVQAGFSVKPSRRERQATSAAAYDCPLLATDGSIIELHRDLSPHGLYPVDPEGLFRRSQAFQFGSTAAMGLANEDLLLHLIIHAAKSQFGLIERKHLRDIRMLLSHGQLDWNQFIAVATVAGCRAAAWFFLRAAERQEGVRLPIDTMSRLVPGRIRRGWAPLWLDLGCFPMLRYPRLPKSLRRLALAPVLVDRWGQLIQAAARFAATRIADQWFRWRRGNRRE